MKSKVACLGNAFNALVPKRNIIQIEDSELIVTAQRLGQRGRHLSGHGVVTQVQLHQAAACTCQQHACTFSGT